jgi:hypothetical protein
VCAQLISTAKGGRRCRPTRIMRSAARRHSADARAGRFDVIIAESLDRFSRDQEHIAAFYKQATFAGISIVPTAEGPISELHVGLKGTTSTLYIKGLAPRDASANIDPSPPRGGLSGDLGTRHSAGWAPSPLRPHWALRGPGNRVPTISRQRWT